MKQRIIALTCLITCGHILLSKHPNADAIPYIPIRSQAVNLARRTVGYTNELLYTGTDSCNYAMLFGLVFEGERSFDSSALAYDLFGGSIVQVGDYPAIRVSGSSVETRNSRDWLADYFGLPTDYASIIRVQPRVSNVLFDLDWFWFLDPLCCGMYLRVNGPIVHTRFDLNAIEKQIAGAALGYDAGYFAADAVAVDSLAPSALCYLSGTFEQRSIGLRPLQYSKWNSNNGATSKSLDKTGFADLHVILGYTLLEHCNYYLSVEARYHAPTGNTPNGCNFFEPMIGNGHHHEAGIGWNAHATIWRDSCNPYRSVSLWCTGFVTHLFKTKQKRVFDLCSGPSSRYMLAARTEPPVTGNLRGSPNIIAPVFTAAQSQFKQEYTAVANLTRLEVEVSAKVQADVVLLFNYSDCRFSWDIGYEFWGRSCEDLHLCRYPETPYPFQEHQWVLKGDAQMFGQGESDATTSLVALSASESKATIFAGTNRPCNAELDSDTFKQNNGIDNPEFAYADIPATDTMLTPVGASDEPISTSIQPVFITKDLINVQGMRSKGISHKIFSHFSYTWQACSVNPFLGFGGSVEFGSRKNCCTENACTTVDPAYASPCRCVACVSGPLPCLESQCDSTVRCLQSCPVAALNQWAIWIKGGLFFDIDYCC